jgi:hypothetical protein
MLNRSKQSGDWVLRNAKYVSFLESTKPDLLWLIAPAGCGKTTLASHIIQNIQVNQASQASASPFHALKPVVLSFFFHKSNMAAEGVATGAFRTMIWQLARQAPETLQILLERYEILSSRGNFDWSCENLLGIIGDMIEQILPLSRLYIVLDALDECEPESREVLMDWLKERLDDSEASQTSRLTKALLKVVVTSRPDGSIFDSLSHFSTVEMTISDTVSDMHNLITTRIGDFARRRDLDKHVSESIIQFLEENAHGMFLWVVLVIQELERRNERLTDEVIKAKLSSIPLKLIPTYETLLLQPSPARRNDMWRILRWLLFGKRGLTLAELEMALCLETGVPRWYDFAGDINTLCGSLVRFDGPRGEISLVHQTAQDFLETFTSTAAPENVSGLEMSTSAANTHLAEICIEYLSKNDDFTGIQYYRGFPSGSAVGSTLTRHPFLYYAAENWASHVRAVGTPDSKLSGLVINFLASEKQRNRLMQLIYHINYRADHCFPRCRHPLHLAAYYNLPWLVDFYILQDPNSVHSENFTHGTPLTWGAEMGSIESVRKLLEAGADPNRVEIDGWSPLHWAVRNGHLQVARLLLEHGARVTRQDRTNEQVGPKDRHRWSSRRKTWALANIFEQWGLQEMIQS